MPAYVNVCLDVKAAVPIAISVAIHGAPPGSIATQTNHHWVNIFKTEGANYSEAHAKALEIIETNEIYSWLRPWFFPKPGNTGLYHHTFAQKLRNCMNALASVIY